MENQAQNTKKQRQRKLMVALPIIALPFITMMFWALGGGKEVQGEMIPAKQAGFNLSLPDANIKEDKQMDKMSYYDQAKLDSAKFRELMKNDPNYQPDQPGMQGTGFANSSNDQFGGGSMGMNRSVYGGGGYNDPHSEKMYAKLEALNRQINSPQYEQQTERYGYDRYNQGTVNGGDIDRLEKMMQMMGQSDGEDPEMKQINGMLEKIMDIQNPERVQEKIRQNSAAKRGRVFPVTTASGGSTVSLMENKPNSGVTYNSFYSLETTMEAAPSQNAIQAVIHENQTIVNGSTVKLRLINDVYVNGIKIPKDNFIFGTASMQGERLEIKIPSIVSNNSLYPVDLSVFDLDGLDGIYIPGAITREVAKQSADRSMQSVGLNSFDPSFGAQAATAGIEAVKTLFSKKITLVKVKVKAGYQVLLRDEKQKQND